MMIQILFLAVEVGYTYFLVIGIRKVSFRQLRLQNYKKYRYYLYVLCMELVFIRIITPIFGVEGINICKMLRILM